MSFGKLLGRILYHLHNNPEYAYEYFCQHKDKRDLFISACQKVFNVQRGPGSIFFECTVSGETGTTTVLERGATWREGRNWDHIEGSEGLHLPPQEMPESEKLSTAAPTPKKRRKRADLLAEQNPTTYSTITVDGSQTRLAGLASEAKLIGSQETIFALRIFLENLRRDSDDEGQPGRQVREHCFPRGVSSTPLSRKLRNLRGIIEFHETKGTLSKCLRRFYLADLAGEYLKVQANSVAQLASTTRRSAKKFVRKIVPHFVDTLFPETTNFAKADATSKEKDIRKKAVVRFMNWKRIGAAWLQFSLRFGAGVLLILPDDLGDQRVRVLSESELHILLDYIDHIHPRLKERVHALTLCLKHLAEEGRLPSKRLQLEVASESQILSEGAQGELSEKYLDFVNDKETGELASSVIGSPVSVTSHFASSIVSSPDLLAYSSAGSPEDWFDSCYTSPTQQPSENSYQGGSSPGRQLQKTLLETVISKTIV